MTLIKSISGMRGTIGGAVGTNLTPIDIVEMASAYGMWLKQQHDNHKVVIGRDGRISGEIVSSLVVNTLRSLGIDIIDLDYSTTPTVEMAVKFYDAGGGIILTASHNPKQWNALKLLNEKGEFISAEDGQALLDIAASRSFDYSSVEQLGQVIKKDDALDLHINAILNLPFINADLIRSRGFKVAVDCINSTGAIALPPLLDALGCTYDLINSEVSGDFAHNPEPLAENLKELSSVVLENNLDLGIAVDPDVDRLVFTCPSGELFGEEYTLVAAADFVLRYKKGATVSNLSSSRALRDISALRGMNYEAAAVGEVNVVKKMKEVNAAIGGEGNGGVILPDLHYGRDALVGIAIVLNLLAEDGINLDQLKEKYPQYHIIKSKIYFKP